MNTTLTSLSQWLTNPSLLALMFMTACVVILLLEWHQRGKVDLSQCIVDSTTNKISIEKMGYMTGMMIGTWGFVDRILTNSMTEYYFSGYMTALVAGRALNSWINAKKGQGDGNPPTAS